MRISETKLENSSHSPDIPCFNFIIHSALQKHNNYMIHK